MRKTLCASLLVLPVLCLAQVAPSNTPASPASHGPRIMAVQATQSVRYAGDLQQLREHLQLTDAQQATWARYQASVEAYSEQYFAETPLPSYAAVPAPRQLELLASTLQKRLDALREITHHAQALYVLLSASQKQTADQQLLASIPVFGNPPNGR